MLKLDVGTMAFSSAIASLAAAIIIISYASPSRSLRHWGLFSLSAAAYGIGVIAIVHRGVLPPMLAIIGGNFMVMVSALALHAGTSGIFGRFDRRFIAVYVLFMLLYLAGYTYYYAAEDNINARIAVISLLRIPVFFHVSVIIHRYRQRHASQGAMMLEVVAGVWAALLIPRSIGALYIEGPIREFVGLVGFQAAYFAASGLGNVLVAVGLLRMESDTEVARLGKMVEEKTEELERQLFDHTQKEILIRSILNASADAVMLFQPDGTLLAVNDVMADRFGCAAEQLVGTSLWDLFPPDVAESRRRASLAVLENGVPNHILDHRGSSYFDNSIYPVAGPDGRADRLAVFSRDITDKVNSEAKIATYITEVERSNAELEQFAYVASHDLREPLRMISSYLSLLERRYGDRLDGDGLEFIGFARDGAKRMDLLVLDLLDLSRIERKGDPIVPMPIMPSVQLALTNLGMTIKDNSATITTDDVIYPSWVLGDPTQIMRLFQNLIGNSLKYRKPDSDPVIQIGGRPLDGYWQFSIGDNGIGIASEYFERVFGIFQRLHTREKYDGTGIGLAVCKKIIERHRGRIWVESIPGEGSTFHFTLPCAPCPGE
ncbi:Phytochrome two-component sensor histidine kinase Cyanobacterial phytochrome B [Paramagnetospirillum magnetotacticum MS-1]|uniref:histidine kinase n=1 Tax=Paramagnetospirillum magnetotacticum MS-1 TaxID=272627 RepID=A0A0C2UG75_PARME|nr:ATP-binding protein [Paramagnetospirillum magnetotacticum]KIM00528.1 Phytochrome two-component sensor histidine kinase Cyanobacterial phytochrome B [Paramagnetospirillum magnetotacticum MS-1]